jgi:adenylosuccinate synthase
LNGVTGIALTKVDALDGFEAHRIAVAYDLDGETIDYVPSNTRAIGRATPVYRDVAGWNESSRDLRSWSTLPQGAQAYVKAVEEACGSPVAYVGTGPTRLALAHR